MNKWQIICPVVTIAVVVLVMGLVHGRRERDYFIRMATYSVGRDLIATTNSSHLIEIGPALQTRLSEVLSSPTHVATVLLGDEAAPIGDGSACSRLFLTNDVADEVELRLGQADAPGMFRVLGFSKMKERSRD